ncbi:MFS transporter [candidate division KSB3 bacterium]|uniref:MFS transporter n=1 Tax=candidate division KSB3 bacterium TaxID=2044937 RepID=A0A2G6KB90_9BACT|nr:MAG: MFS transporter [candidate division KSB3 bacterium]
MLFRFSLYGFLKNQKYYEPFLILAFLEKGFSFFQIGILVGVREVCMNLFEIPSGALADMYGRRHSMIVSMLAYIVSFIIFATSASFALLCLAMFFFAIGEAFRTGTHKAMIFEWLRKQRRSHERIRIYGYTRSWSKTGSAVSVVISSALVFYSGRYSDIFWFSIPPYLLNIVNFLSYPGYLDGHPSRTFSLKQTAFTLWSTLRESGRSPVLRRLFLETIGFEGSYKISKDYLQPIVEQAALSLPLLLWLGAEKRSAVLIGVVYLLMSLLSIVASRNAYHLSERMGGENKAVNTSWKIHFILFFVLIPVLGFQLELLAILVFITLEMLQNVWRPVQVTRFDRYSDGRKSATILSIDSQAKSLFTMLAAPALGLIVDRFGFWPIGVLGAGLAAFSLLYSTRIE